MTKKKQPKSITNRINLIDESCNSCGAAIVFEAREQSLICHFCGAINKVDRPEDTLEISFDRVVPITVTPHELVNRIYAYMASGNFTPDDMIEVSTITLQERYYVPAFKFMVDYVATWSATFGYNRQETYTAYRNVYENGHTRREAYTAYRTVTDWYPTNGVDDGIFSVAGYAGIKLNGFTLAPAKLVAHAVINGSSTIYNSKFIKGFKIEGFSIPEKNVFESLSGEINTNIDERVKNHAQGDKQRDWHWNARMSHDTTTYAVPICHGAFQYKDKEYHVWVGGHDVDTIRADELPVDKDKENTANISFIPGTLGLATIIGSAFYWSFEWSSLITTFLTLWYGFERRKALIDYSKSIRNSILIQMQASNQADNLSSEEQEKVAKAFQRPERPFFANVQYDVIILPALAVFAFLGAVVPNADLNPATISQWSIADQAAAQADEARRDSEEWHAQEAVNKSNSIPGNNPTIPAAQDYDDVFYTNSNLAEQGNVEAQFNLGKLYAEGHGVQRNLVFALAWFDLAISNNNSNNNALNIDVKKHKAELIDLMTPELIFEANNLSSSWQLGQNLTPSTELTEVDALTEDTLEAPSTEESPTLQSFVKQSEEGSQLIIENQKTDRLNKCISESSTITTDAGSKIGLSNSEAIRYCQCIESSSKEYCVNSLLF